MLPLYLWRNTDFYILFNRLYPCVSSFRKIWWAVRVLWKNIYLIVIKCHSRGGEIILGLEIYANFQGWWVHRLKKESITTILLDKHNSSIHSKPYLCTEDKNSHYPSSTRLLFTGNRDYKKPQLDTKQRSIDLGDLSSKRHNYITAPASLSPGRGVKKIVRAGTIGNFQWNSLSYKWL